MRQHRLTRHGWLRRWEWREAESALRSGECAQAANRAVLRELVEATKRNPEGLFPGGGLTDGHGGLWNAERLLEAWSRPEFPLAHDLAEEAKRVVPPPQRQIVHLRRQEQGELLDPLAYIQRDPSGWSERRRLRTARRIVRVLVNIGLVANEPPALLLHRGAAAMALRERLSRVGRSVVVDAAWTAETAWEPQREPATTVLRVITPGCSRPAGRLALACANAAAFRLLLPLQIQAAPALAFRHCGTPTEQPESLRESYDLCVPLLYSEGHARRWLDSLG